MPKTAEPIDDHRNNQREKSPYDGNSFLTLDNRINAEERNEQLIGESLINSKLTLFSKRAVIFASYLGGPLAAGLALRYNYRQMGKYEEGKLALFAGALLTLALIGLAVFLPSETKIPLKYFGFLIVFATWYFIYKLQGAQLREHFKNGAKKAPWYRIFGYGSISIVFTVGLWAVIASVIPAMEGNVVKVGKLKNELYYSNTMSKQEAEKVGEVFVKEGFFDTVKGVYAKVEKDDSGYKLLIPIDSRYWDDNELLGDLKFMESYLNYHYYEGRMKIIIFNEDSGQIKKKEI